MQHKSGARSSRIASALESAFSGLMSGVNTTYPGYFLHFDAATQLASIQIAIKLIDDDGNNYIAPPLIKVPVQFSGGNEFIIEHQIDVGDEGIILFSQRCIDAWVDQGKIAPQSMRRVFDAADALFIPGMRSLPNKIISFSNNGIKLRNKTGDQFIWLKNDGTAQIDVSTLNINGDVVHTGNTTQTGNHDTTGTSTATISVILSTLTVNGKNLGVHNHPAGTPPGNTGDNN